MTANKKETYSPKSLILILFVALLPSANCNIFFHCYHLQISHEYKARPSLDNKRKQGIGFFHENLIIISKMLCHHTLMINSIFTYSTTLKNLASSSCFFAEVLNWFQSLHFIRKNPWPIGFLAIISGRYINKVNLLRCFYIVHRKNRERKQPQHPVSYCPTVNDDYFRLCGIPRSLLLTRKYCCHNKNGGIRVF